MYLLIQIQEGHWLCFCGAFMESCCQGNLLDQEAVGCVSAGATHVVPLRAAICIPRDLLYLQAELRQQIEPCGG